MIKSPNMVKSPSDTTLYKPALSKRADKDMLNRISNFVENIRIETSTANSSKDGMNGTPVRRTNVPQEIPAPREEEPVILQAEHIKANLSAPTGEIDNDDNFFHVACLIDSNLHEKIEKGEFIDLEQLLPKKAGSVNNTDSGRLELVSQDGLVYFAPVQDRGKITGIRTWEQAFRVYAAIYSKAQPSRASEIWQYIHVINIVAASYTWENVAFYDFTFRQLMSEKLHRSGSKTYTQGWNLAMTEPLNKHSAPAKGGCGQVSGTPGGPSGSGKSWRDRCCWKFNRNKCMKGSSCDWDHCCTYCGGWNHSYLNCHKRAKKHDDKPTKHA